MICNLKYSVVVIMITLLCIFQIPVRCEFGNDFVDNYSAEDRMVHLIQTYCSGRPSDDSSVEQVTTDADSEEIERHSFDANLAHCIEVMDILKTHSFNGEIAANSLMIIETFSTDDKTRELLGKAGACSAVINLMHIHFRDEIVVKHGFLTIGHLAYDEANRELLSSVGTPTSVIGLLRLHIDNSELAMRGLFALGNLAMSPTNNVILGKSGACQCIISVMNHHHDDAYIAKYGMIALGNLAADSRNNEILLLEGITTALLETLQIHRNDVSVVENALFAIGNMASSYNSQDKFASNKFAGITIVDGIRVHMMSYDTVMQGLIVIHHLANHPSIKLAFLNNEVDLLLMDILKTYIIPERSVDDTLALHLMMAVKAMLAVVARNGATDTIGGVDVDTAASHAFNNLHMADIVESLVVRNYLLTDEECRDVAKDIVLMLRPEL